MNERIYVIDYIPIQRIDCAMRCDGSIMHATSANTLHSILI